MSYQVLARKWRPQNFHQLVGQNHVKQALINGLEQQRLHHAYLFTGTRGVGKTTIARIFSKSLNCEQGITAEPCGTCSTCLDIEEGRYIDLLEIDAASRTKVEDTREILDNVQYAPSRGRYKVYLIDEVHMLSKHSFNALLKTLEEPPEHVKFLLATTDPQKLPVTILSRCLQFNLSALSQDEIKQQLETILTKEQLTFDSDALKLLAKSADGSMRDALSLTDQAIAQTNGQLETTHIMTMLGLIDISWSQKLFAAIVCNDGEALLEIINQLSMQNPSYKKVLDDLLALTHLTLMTQLVPSAAELDDNNESFITEIAHQSNPEQIQVYYQLLLNGKKDLLWAPEAKLGFEMVLLRLLAFEPSAPMLPSASNHNVPSNQAAKSSKMANLRQILDKPSLTSQKVESQTSKLTGLNESSHAQAQQTNAAVVATAEDEKLKELEQKNNNIPVDTESNIQLARPEREVVSNSLNTVDAQDTTESDIANQMQDVLLDAQQVVPESHNLSNQFENQGIQNSAHKGESVPNTYEKIASYPIEQGEIAPKEQTDTAAQQANSQPVNHKAEQSENITDDTVRDVSKMMSGAQSAIARILANRNISGTGQLSAPSDVDIQPQEASTANKELNVKKTEPQRGETEVTIKSEIKSKKPRSNTQVHERIKSDPANLAPELLVQISGEKQEVEEEIEQVIEIPENFKSPLSDIKFAYQKDHWADIINKMALGGRIRQFALHSTYQKQNTQVLLNVDLSQQHLDSQMLRDQLQSSLSQVLNESITLQVQFEGTVENSPYLIQQKLDSDRLCHAIEVLKQDPVITQFVSRFDAQMDESSVLTR